MRKKFFSDMTKNSNWGMPKKGDLDSLQTEVGIGQERERVVFSRGG